MVSIGVLEIVGCMEEWELVGRELGREWKIGRVGVMGWVRIEVRI